MWWVQATKNRQDKTRPNWMVDCIVLIWLTVVVANSQFQWWANGEHFWRIYFRPIIEEYFHIFNQSATSNPRIHPTVLRIPWHDFDQWYTVYGQIMANLWGHYGVDRYFLTFSMTVSRHVHGWILTAYFINIIIICTKHLLSVESDLEIELTTSLRGQYLSLLITYKLAEQ